MVAIAVEIASAYVSLSADTRQIPKDVRKALGQAEGAASSSGQSIGQKISSGLGKTLKAGALAGGAAAGAALGVSLKKGFDRLSAIEQSEAKLTGLGHSTQSVAKIMDNALGSVKGTAYGLGDAASVAAGMVASGIKPGKELEGVLKTMGDTAAIAGRDLTDMGLIFQSVAAKGKLQGDDMLQLMSSGIPVLQLLGDELGKTSAEVSDMVSAGEIDFETFEKAMKKGMGGAALEAGKTFKGSMDNMGAAMGRLGEIILKGAFNKAPEVIGKLTDGIDLLGGKIKEVQAYVSGDPVKIEEAFGVDGATNIPFAYELISAAVWKLRDGFDEIKKIAAWTSGNPKWLDTAFGVDGATDVPAHYERISYSFWKLRDAMDKMRGSAELFFTGDFNGGIREKLGVEEDDPLVDQILNIRDAFIDWGERVGNVFREIGELALALAPSFGRIAAALGKATAKVSAATWEALLRIVEALVPVLEKVLVPAFEKLAKAMEEHPGLVTALVGAFAGLKIIKLVSGPLKMIGGIAKGASGGFKLLSGALGAGKAAGKGGKIGAALLHIAGGAKSTTPAVAKMGTAATKAVGGLTLFGKIGAGLSKVLGPVGRVLGGIVGKLGMKGILGTVGRVALKFVPFVGWIWTAYEALKWFFTKTETGKKVFEGLKNVLSDVWNWIKDTFVTGFEWAGDKLGSLWDGVTNAWDTAWQGISNFISSAWEGIKTAWDTVGQPIVDFIVRTWDKVWFGIRLGARLVRATFIVLWTAIQKIWENVAQPQIDRIRHEFDRLWNGLKTVFGWIRSGWDWLWQKAQEAYATYVVPVIDWIKGAFENMKNWLVEAWGWVKQKWTELWQGVQNAYHTYIQPVVDWVVTKFNEMRDKVAEAWNWVKTKISEFAGWVRGKMTEIGNTISRLYDDHVAPWVDRMRRGIDRVIGFFTGMKDRIVDGFNGAKDWLIDAGRRLIEGLINGIKQMGSKIKDTLGNLVPDWVKGPFEEAMDINSPSRVFAKYGQFIGQGLVNGIESMGKKVEKATKGMADRVSGVDMPTVQVSAQLNDQGLNVEASAQNVSAKVSEANPAPSSRYEGGAPPAVQSVEQGTESFEASSEAVNASVQATFDPAVQQADLSMSGFGANVQATATGVVTPQWQGMANSVASAANGVIAPAFGAVQAGLSNTGARFVQQTTGVMTPMFNAMGANVARVRQAVTDPAMAGIRSALSATGAHFTSSVNGTINPIWTAMGNHVKAVKDGTVLPVFNAVEGGLTQLSGWFGTSVNNIGTAWDRLRGATARPAKFVVETVMNNGIRNAWNAVADLIDEKKMNPVPLGTLGGYATGGILPGYTPGRDVHQFVSPSGLHIGLSGGEAIMRPEVARALGTSGVDSLNSAARMGGVGAVKKTLGGFAGGGVVESISGLVRKHFPMMSITSTYRNSNDHHGAGKAVDFSNGTDSTPEMRSAAQWFYTNYGKGLLELIHSPFKNNVKDGQNVGDGFGFYGAGTMNGHRNHVHVAAPRPLGAPKDPNFVLTGGSSLAGFAAPSMEEIAKDAWDAEIKKIPKYSGGPGMFDSVPSGYQKKATSSAWKYLQKKAESSFGAAFSGDTGGAGVERWRGLVRHILGVKGLSKSLDNTTLRRMNQESGGNPRAINNWDINAVNGTPSKGLMQVIDPTFRANADPGFNSNIWDPESNIRASMNYALRQYGSLPAAYDRAGGYDSGGFLQPGVTRVQNDSGKPEPVFSHKQWQVLKGNIMSAAQAGDLKKLQINLGVVANGLQQAVAKLDWQEIFGAASKAFNDKFFEDQAADVRSVFGVPDPDSIPAVKAFAEFRENEKKLNEEQAQAAKESREAAVQSNEAADKISAVAPVPVKARSESVSVGSQVARTGALVSRALANPNPVSVGAAAASAGQTINFVVRNEEAAWSEYRKFQAKNSRGRVGAR